MAKLIKYTGRRDPRFVTISRGGLLNNSTHRLLAVWAAECAEHVLPLFTARSPHDDRPARAIETAQAWSRDEATVDDARKAAAAAHAAARSLIDPVAREVARACGHAVATAHMADHELGAPFYAIRAVRLATPSSEAQAAGECECRWQRARLPDAIRELVLSDQKVRAAKFQSVFDC